MPEHLKALVVVLGIAFMVFAVAKAPACSLAMAPGDFDRRRNLWFAITLTAFLAHNFWVYILVATAFLLHALPREPNKHAMYLFLLFAVPTFPVQITGLGIIEHFFTIHYVRLLALAILLPSFLHLRAQPDVERFGRSIPDKLIAGYLVLQFVLTLMDSSVTQTLRHGAFYAFTDVFLPYYVASRAPRNLQHFREALMAFAVAVLVLGGIGTFEYAKQWLLYNALEDVLGVERWGYGNYLLREHSLRALATTGQPIVLGYVVSVAAGFYLYLRRIVPGQLVWGLGLMLLLAGLIAPVSRGPWVGASAMLVAFVALGPSPAKGLVKLGLLAVVVVGLMLMSPARDRVIDLIPFVGSVEERNIEYRQRFTEVSIAVIKQNPFFGTRDYVDLAEMEELKPQGLLDTLNVFLTVGLASGLVGLGLFAGFFLAVAAGIFRGMWGLADWESEQHLLGRALLATLLGIVVTINTVSNILFIPVVYWTVTGLGVAYARMLALAAGPNRAASTNSRTEFAGIRTRQSRAR